MEDDEIISFKDLVKLLNITSNKLTRLTKQGLPCVSLRNENWVFLKSSVTEWLKSKEEQQGD